MVFQTVCDRTWQGAVCCCIRDEKTRVKLNCLDLTQQRCLVVVSACRVLPGADVCRAHRTCGPPLISWWSLDMQLSNIAYLREKENKRPRSRGTSIACAKQVTGCVFLVSIA